MCSCSAECCCQSINNRRRMFGCRMGVRFLVPLLWLAAAAAAIATVVGTTASTRSPVSQPPSVCQQQQRPLGGSPLRPTELWQFAEASISALTDSCHFTIEAPPKSSAKVSSSRDAATTPATASEAAAASAVTPSYSSLPNASATLPAPQLLVVRLISWHPGSDCARETCSRNSSMSLQGDGGRCAVALSLAQRRSFSAAAAGPVGAGDSSRSVDALLVTGDGGGTGSSSSLSASASSTIAWTDTALNAIVSGSGCCGARLLLGYKVAPARSACRSASTLATASSSPSRSPSSSDVRTDTPSPHQYSTPELVDKYTYLFAQDRKLGWLPQGGVGDDTFDDTSATVCGNGQDYLIILLPAEAAALAEQEVRFDLLTAPTRRSCRRLCIADDCWPRLGVFNASRGRPLSVRYEYRSATVESGGVCVDHEYSGFTLRLLAPSRVQFATFASPPLSPPHGASYKSDWVLIIAPAAGAAAILTVLTTAIAVLVVRRRRHRRRQPASPNTEMRSTEMSCKGQLPLVAADSDDNHCYEEVQFNESGKGAETRYGTVESTYWTLKIAAEGVAGDAEPDDNHVYSEFVK